MEKEIKNEAANTVCIAGSADNRHSRPLAVEAATLVYTLFTSLLILLLHGRMTEPWHLLGERGLIVAGMVLIYLVYRSHPGRYTLFLRYLFPLTLLGYWYPDTYEFCQLFPNLDHVFASADAALFGCQPSVSFSAHMPEKVWSELFHMGYFSYYPLIALTVLAPLFTRRELFAPTAFTVLTAFLLYYTIYLFLPVAGPQYYFHAVGSDLILSGHFPHLGDYFRYHTELASSPGADGLFRTLVEATQASGERPTAAFPSSHVGMSTVMLVLLWRNRHSLFWCALPFYVLLCCATVYIQAHYLVDVFAGLVTAVMFLALCDWLWHALQERGEAQ